MEHHIHPSLEPLAVDIDSIRSDPKNARTGHALAQIGKSLDRYGQRKPIVVNARTNTIEAGNGTWQAAKDLGWSHIAAVMVEDDAETATGFAIADNRLADISFFDPGNIADILEGIDDPLDIPGVSADWLEGLGVGDPEKIDFEGDGHAGDSPWDRIKDKNNENTLFSFGEVVCNIKNEYYEKFLSIVSEKDDVAKYICSLIDNL